MSWRRHFQSTDKLGKLNKETDQMMAAFNSGSSVKSSKFSSYLPEIYTGHPQRLDRYLQYDNMDQDSEINISLDTIADTSTSPEDDDSNDIFKIDFFDEPNTTEMEVVRGLLGKWVRINEWRTRMWEAFRNTLKYGDSFFIRDPQTGMLLYVDPYNVEKIIVDNSQGRKPSVYMIRNIEPNLADKVATVPERQPASYNASGANGLSVNNANTSSVIQDSYGPTKGGSQGEVIAVDAAHVVHLSLSSGLDANWPFGTSILEPLFKVYKQKELLEDSILIYRIQRAPERRAFYIDTGEMPLHKTGAYLEKVKMESQQRRMPSRTGGGMSVTDARFDPMAMLDDYYFARNSEGRGSSMEILTGGENLGCFPMNTKIILEDGRELTIKEIEEELKNGKPLYTYSCHPTNGSIKKGLISWAGVTRKDAEVLRVYLSNGKSFMATPDHQFPIKDRGFVKLSELEEGDCLIGTTPVKDHFITKWIRKILRRPEEVMIRKIKKVKRKMDVGTLTIDTDHIFHDYHTYALAAGVFAKNSIDDLKFFSNKLVRGLRIPSSYIPTGPDDGQAVFTDGRVGTAYLQEYRFSVYCRRLQNKIVGALAKEFKLFIKQQGFDKIDTSSFDINFFPPQNFRRFAQIERDAASASVFQTLQDVPFIAKRTLLSRYLGWSDEEIIENEKRWKEERSEMVQDNLGSSDRELSGLDSIGIKPTDQFGGDDFGDGEFDDADAGDEDLEGAEGGDDLNTDDADFGDENAPE